MLFWDYATARARLGRRSRLVGMVHAEQDDEWQDGRRYLRSETMAVVDAVIAHEGVSPALMIAS